MKKKTKKKRARAEKDFFGRAARAPAGARFRSRVTPKYTRPKLDFYETPAWCVQALLKRVAVEGTVLDVGAGSGAILRELLNTPDVCAKIARASGVEIDPALVARAQAERLPVVQGDFLQVLRQPLFSGFDPVDVIIGNPPYRYAEDFVFAATRRAQMVVFLLRLNFLEAQSRAGFFQNYMPDVYVLPKRPSFTKNGRTDRTAYAWFVWGQRPRGFGDAGAVEVLDLHDLDTTGNNG